MKKCDSCKDRYDDKRIITLPAYEMGHGSLNDVLVCVNCYHKFERELDDECS